MSEMEGGGGGEGAINPFRDDSPRLDLLLLLLPMERDRQLIKNSAAIATIEWNLR